MRKKEPADGRTTKQCDENYLQATHARAKQHGDKCAQSPRVRDAGFENRVTLFCFLLTILVVYVHALNLGPAAGRPVQPAGTAGAWFSAAENVLSNFISSAAVPGFFLLSAYLFFRGLRAVHAQDGLSGLARAIFGKWRRRIRSLLLPFLLWNAIYYLLYVLFRGAPLSASVAISALLDYRYNPVFWYMQQLILLTLLAPLVLVLAWNRFLRVPLLYAAILLAAHYELLPFHLVNEDAFVYYLAGAMFGLDEEETLETCGTKRAFACASVFALLAAIAAGVLLHPQAWHGKTMLLTATILFRLCAPIALLFLLTLLRLPQRPLPGFMRINFFVYAVHFLLVRLVNRILFRVAPEEAGLLFAAYLLMPVLCFAVCYGLSLLLRCRLPGIYKLLTGGRN